MQIQKAQVKDFKGIADLMMLAMRDFIFDYIGEESNDKALKFLHHFIQLPDNLYSYQNCWIIKIENQIVGVANVYDGAQMEQLRKTIYDYISTEYNTDLTPLDETGAGEYYIDSIAIYTNQQGKGLGSTLLNFLKQEYVTNQQLTLGLLVDKKNPGAKKLYLKHGFEYVNDKIFGEKEMEHLQLKP